MYAVFGPFRGFLYEIGDIIVVLGNSFRPYSRDCSSHYFGDLRHFFVLLDLIPVIFRYLVIFRCHPGGIRSYSGDI